MDFYDQLNAHVRELNQNERNVFDYVVHNLDRVKDMSIRSLAEACFVSTTTILRFCRKLGFSGYRELTDALKLASHTAPKTDIPLVLWRKEFTEEYLKDILESIRVTSSSTIDSLCRAMESAGCIICYGQGLDREIAHYLQQVLIRLDLPAVCPASEVEAKAIARAAQDGDVAVVFSLSGENPRTIEFIERLHARHRPRIATITNSGKNTVANLGDFDFYIFINRIQVDGEDLSSRTSMMALIDFISYDLIKRRSRT